MRPPASASKPSPLALVGKLFGGRDLGLLQIPHVLSVCGLPPAPSDPVKMCSIVVLMESTSSGHLLELCACWNVLQHFCIQLDLSTTIYNCHHFLLSTTGENSPA